MTEPGQSPKCQYSTDDGNQCILLTTPCVFPANPACCSLYHDRKLPSQDPDLVRVLRGELRYADCSRWYIETPLTFDSLDYVFAHFVDEEVKLTIEKVRE